MRAAAGLLVVVAGLAAAGASARKPAVPAIYTAEQAAQGARVYAIRCAMCHGARLEGVVEIPALTGRFIVNWGNRPVADLFDYVSRAMPQPAPGSLSPADNARLAAFLLRENGYPAGAKALPADPAALRRLVPGPPGPLP